MNKRSKNRGFTMAELLIVVAILVVLAGVSFVAIQNQQRSMSRLEYDTIAKEIFIAAQNHLTTAKSQGYLTMGAGGAVASVNYGRTSSFGTDSSDKVYYIVYPDTGTPPPGSDMLDLMLPFGSVDETFRAGGNYIIRYQPSSATVLDVFFSYPDKKTSMLTVKGVNLTASDYYNGSVYQLMNTCRGDSNRDNRQNYNGGVVGWYGLDGTSSVVPVGERLNIPTITVHNEEKLWVEVTHQRIGSESLELIVKGKTSDAKTAIQLYTTNITDPEKNNRITPTPPISGVGSFSFKIILDDITSSGLQFANLPADSGSAVPFIPGEDIEIEALAYDNTVLTNIAPSGARNTNSLFAKINGTTAEIDNVRHLENLDNTISNLGSGIITAAEQKVDLVWKDGVGGNDFVSAITNTTKWPLAQPTVSIFKWNTNGTNGDTNSDCYFPVSPNYSMTYDGQNHSISKVQVDYIGDAGLFGSTSTVTEISNLELIDFNISGTTNSTVTTANAGALAGSLTGCTVTNVLARNKDNSATSLANKITATTNAGGLIGKLTGGTVQYSAAAVIVDGGTTAYAGGLVGTVSGNVNNCYSGGHTLGGSYQSWIDAPHPYDVTGATAGGLIGSSSATINNCYSTCSVSGTSYGAGLLGKVTNGSITNCYATGMIDPAGANNYAFIASGTPTTFSNNYYYMTINEVEVTDSKTGKTTIEPMKPFFAEGEHELSDYFPHTTPLDLNASFYNDFVGGFSAWDSAEAYDNPSLLKYYNGKYPLRTVLQLPVQDSDAKTKSSSDYFISKHYGDWPAPEIFIINN